MEYTAGVSHDIRACANKRALQLIIGSSIVASFPDLRGGEGRPGTHCA